MTEICNSPRPNKVIYAFVLLLTLKAPSISLSINNLYFISLKAILLEGDSPAKGDVFGTKFTDIKGGSIAGALISSYF